MRFLRHTPIKRKLTILTMLTSGVALLLACVTFAIYDQIKFRASMAINLSVLTDLYDDNVASGLTFNESKSIEQTLKSLDGHPHILAAAVYNKSGQVVARYQRADLKAPFLFPPAQKTGAHFEKERLNAFRTIVVEGDEIGSVYISSDLRELDDLFWLYVIIVSVVLAAALLVAFFLSARLQSVISGPISHLAAVANTVAADKNFSVRALKEGDDELGRLIDGFNEMLGEIQSRDSALQEAHGSLEKRVAERTTELASSLSLLNATLNSMADGILVVDFSGKVSCSNQRFATLWSIPDALLKQGGHLELVAHGALQMRDPDEYLKRIEALQIDVESEAFDVLELKDGRTFERFIYPQRLGDTCVGRVINFRDVTERKRAEEARRQSESQFRQVWNASADGMRLTNGEGLVLMVNDAYCRVVGKTKAELEGHSLAIIHEVGERERILGKHRERLHSMTEPTQMEKEIALWDGRKMWIDLSNSLLQVPGQPPLLLSIFRDISARKLAEAELEQTHRQLIDTSRQAGMAEVATGVLHNVGNVLNSVNVSTTLVAEQLNKSKLANLAKAVALMNEHEADLGAFITHDPKGKQLPGYLTQLASYLATEQTTLIHEIEQLRKNIEHIKDIVAMQQSYARVSGVTETLKISDLIEDALRMNASALTRHEVEVVRDFEEVPLVTVDKHKVLQVLVNLIRNAKYACDDSGRPDKRMTLRVANDGNRFRISISDNGVGIPAENMVRIFNHGFTTRKEGHGFGLHSGALAARELGGSLSVQSDGVGCGASFTLELPFQKSTYAS
jgi:PAS domain S-box-containing protein